MSTRDDGEVRASRSSSSPTSSPASGVCVSGHDGLERLALGHVSAGVLVIDAARIVRYMNPEAERLTGWSAVELLGQAMSLLVPVEQRGRHDEAFTRLEAIDPNACASHVEVDLLRRDGTQLRVAVVGSRVAADDTYVRVLTLRELNVRAEGGLHSLLSVATTGLAHDISNLLGLIGTYAELLEPELPSGDGREMLDSIAKAAHKGHVMSRELLALYRRQVRVPEQVDVASLVHELVGVFTAARQGKARVEVRTGGIDGHVFADRKQLEQVLLNLLSNAHDAIQPGGMVTVSTGTVGESVCIRVSDTGGGMDESTRARIFEPFFTTKGSRGTGLGLAIVAAITEQSGGRVEVESDVGHGSTFSIFLPRSRKPSCLSRADVGKGGPGGGVRHRLTRNLRLLQEDPRYPRAKKGGSAHGQPPR